MIRRRVSAVSIVLEIGCHTAPRHGNYPLSANRSAFEHMQDMAAHESPRPTKLYDRTKERLTRDEVGRMRL